MPQQRLAATLPSRRRADTGVWPLHVHKQIENGDVPHRNGPLRRIAIAPFEIFAGVMAAWAGLSGLFGWSLGGGTAAAHLLPGTLGILCNFLYAVSGLAITGAIIHKIPQVEAFGLVALCASVVIRALVVGVLVGTGTLLTNLIVVAVFVNFFCGIRLWVLMSGKSVMLAERSREEDQGAAVVSRAI